MLFITPARDAKEAKDYFTRHISTSDYYLRDATEFAGEWHGLDLGGGKEGPDLTRVTTERRQAWRARIIGFLQGLP
jgi:hypothetical protein